MTNLKCKHNAEIGLYGQTLKINSPKFLLQAPAYLLLFLFGV